MGKGVIMWKLGMAIMLGILVVSAPSESQPSKEADKIERELAALAWQKGPTEGHLGGLATVKVEEHEAFLDGPNTRRFLELNGNPPRDNHYTLVGPEMAWFAVFSFNDTGYVKDDEKLDPDALLKALRDADGPGNEERKRLGMTPLYTDGWHVPPHYDPTTKQLEWGVRLRNHDGRPLINYTVRLLGRRGVMQATLVSDPQRLEHDISEFKAALTGYSFVAGERYAEFRRGDRVAEYGLAALVLGGAAVVATKTGFLKAFGKLIVIGVVGLGSAVAAFFRRFSRREPSPRVG